MTSKANQFLERISSIQLAIQVPGLGIPIVLSSNPYQPSNVASVECPFWINEILLGLNPAALPIADGLQYITTNLRMVLCVARKEANIDLKYGIKETLAWRDAVFAMFAKHIRLSAPEVLISSSTNSNPIIVSTNTPHCLNVSGDQVTISGHLVNTNANGVWNATILDSNTFSIPVAGNGVGGATGSAVMTQSVDLADSIEDVVINQWGLVNYEYGDSEFLALAFILPLREFYTQPMSP